jgi:hypothetical protein
MMAKPALRNFERPPKKRMAAAMMSGRKRMIQGAVCGFI